MTAVEKLRQVYANRDSAARAFKAGGGKVVGYFEDNVPEEVIIAAGMMPYRISGDPHQPTDSLKKYLYPFWKKHGLSNRQVLLGFQMSMLDLIYRGRYDFVDFLIIPYSRKGVLGYWQQLRDAKKGYPDLDIPDSWVLDRAMTPGFDSSRFNQQRIFDYKLRMEELVGSSISENALADAIKLTNAIRDGIDRLSEIRKEGRVSGCEALALIGAGAMMDRAEYLETLTAALDELSAAEVRPGKRIFIAGSPQDNDQLYSAVEASGATVVGENHYWGMPPAEYRVDETMEPLIAIGDMYHKKPAMVVIPIQRAIDEVVRRAQNCGADAVVYSVYDHDNQEIWTVPDTIDELKKVGIPSLYFKQQPYLIKDPEAVTEEVTNFLKQIGDVL